MSNDLTDLSGLKSKENNLRVYNKTQYNTNNIKIGQEFKDLTALSLAVTGKKPPTGKRNRDTFLKHLYRHIEFCPSQVLDPTIKSKRQLTILEIYEPPLEIEDNRGRHGEYADLLRPIILRNFSFCGKMSTLLNDLGIFKRLFDEEIRFQKYKYDKIPDNQFHLWKAVRAHSSALNVYGHMMYRQVGDTIKRNLNSLQDQGCLTWNEYFMIIPDIFTAIEESADIRPKSKEIILPQEQQRKDLLEHFIHMDNCVLNVDSLNTICIYSDDWSNEYSLYDYKQACLINNGTFPIRASKQQEQGLNDMNLFFQQLACSNYPENDTLIPLNDMPDEFEFWNNFTLVRRYNKLQQEYAPILTGCKKQWRELEFQVNRSHATTIKYLNGVIPSLYASADKLTGKFIKYMDKQLNRTEFKLPKSELDDCIRKFFWNKPLYEVKLSDCRSVIDMQSHLKDLYSDIMI